MRLFLSLALCCLATAAVADPTCTINQREGMQVSARSLPAGTFRNTVMAGTTVELFTLANDTKGCPWALLREPGNLDNYIGWVDRRTITCR
ncbi:MAG: hypothetical protein AAF318_16530 [Pseudomonadota bacterium]